jgi:hypothetical protein
MYAVLDTAPPSVLKLPVDVDWPATNVPALSRSIYRLQCSLQSTQLENRRLRAFPIENKTTGVALVTIFTAARHTGTQSMAD